jgi:uncharacterized protein (DUF1330 family)
MSNIVPTQEQLKAFAENGPDGPIVMVNLLKYRDREAYMRYGAVAMKCVAARGGSIAWMGRQALVFIGGPENEWDDIVCVRYPSRAAFLDMIADPEYLAATAHRDAGLARTALLCCEAGSAA